MFFSHRIIAATLLITLLAACGQKGALFLAPQSVPYSFIPTAATAPAATASAAK